MYKVYQLDTKALQSIHWKKRLFKIVDGVTGVTMELIKKYARDSMVLAFCLPYFVCTVRCQRGCIGSIEVPHPCVSM